MPWVGVSVGYSRWFGRGIVPAIAQPGSLAIAIAYGQSPAFGQEMQITGVL